MVSHGAQSSSDWQFKFANFGLSARDKVPQDGENPSNDMQDTAPYGTYQYAASPDLL